jgi:hypothetical protein
MSRLPCARIAAPCVALCLLPIGADAQSAPAGARWSVHGGIGALLGIPDQLESEPCGSFYGADGRLGASLVVSAMWVLESSVSVSIPRPTTCAADVIPLPPDASFTYRAFEGVDEDVFVYSTHRVTLDTSPLVHLGPRVSLGGGSVWSHGLWFWSAGLGVPLGSKRPGPMIEVERMQVRLRFTEETLIFSGGEIVGRSSSGRMSLDESMWSVRVRLPIR